jgi:3-phenylpropionate/trans-cinnamate dioxygenase ferredoxin subunit
MSDYLRACAVDDLADDSAIGVELDGVPVCVAKSEGEVFAVHDVCSHADVPLSEGDVTDGTVECWLHGSTFDLRSGRPNCPPAVQPVRVYPVKIDGDDVLVAVKE